MFELSIMLSRYLFLLIIVYFLWQGIVYLLDERNIRKSDRAKAIARQRTAILLLHTAAYLILSWLPAERVFRLETLLVGGFGLLFYLFAYFTVGKVYRNSCPLLWNGVFLLTDTGLVMIQRLNGELAKKQLTIIFFAYIVMLLIPLVFKLVPKFEKLEKAYLAAALVCIALPFFFGQEKFGAVNWIQIGNLTFQPSELVKFLLVFYLASALRKKSGVRQLILPAFVTVTLIAVLMAQKDLGCALIFFMIFMVMMYISTGSAFLFLAGFVLAGAAIWGAYYFLSDSLLRHMAVRLSAWRDPWQDRSGDGYQIIQSYYAIGTWGFLGSGLTKGYPLYVPVVESDFIFAAISEEFGSFFGIGLIGVSIMIFYRGAHISLRCERRYYSLLAAGFTGILAFQTFLILGGVIRLIPLTGVTMPFVSYGGSSIFVSLLMIGIIQWIYMFYEVRTSE